MERAVKKRPLKLTYQDPLVPSPKVRRGRPRDPPSQASVHAHAITEEVQVEPSEDTEARHGHSLDVESSDVGITEMDLQLAGGGDVIGKCRVLGSDECPRIPLCRLIPYARVRGLREDVDALKSAFQSEGYLPEKGAFIVSLQKCDGEETLVSNAIKQSWSPIWREVDDQFEKDISRRRELKFMCKKMFYVWEGNHRTTAWMALISESFPETKSRHIRVMCTLIDPTKTSEISLLAGLQRLNSLNEHAVIKPSLRDILINANNICECDPDVFMSSLPIEEASMIEKWRSAEAKGKKPWYPLTRGYLARLVFQVEYTTDLKKSIEKASPSVPTEQRAAIEQKQRVTLQKKISDRMGKVLNCLDPKHGDVWKSRLFALHYESRNSCVTLEKLRLLALSELKMEKKIAFLSLLEANRVMRELYFMPTGDVEYRSWLSREVFLEKVETQGYLVLDDLSSIMSIVENFKLPEDYTLTRFMEDIKLEGRKHMFASLRAKEARLESKSKKRSEGSQASKLTELEQAAHRLVFRYLSFLVNEKRIDCMPRQCKSWTETGNVTSCMYPKNMHDLSQWELENCPWWIDFPTGQVLNRERESYRLHSSSEQVDVLGKEKVTEAATEATASRKAIRQRKEKNIAIATEVIMESSSHNGIDVSEGEFVAGGSHVGECEVTKKVLQYVYHGPPYIGSLVTRIEPECKYACLVGDYIEMGIDVLSSRKNPQYGKIHEFFLSVAIPGKEYRRLGRNVKWAADFILLDLPTGFPLAEKDNVPSWNILSEDHLRQGLAVAGSSLADSGWLVVICPFSGPGISWMERYTRVQGLEVDRRVILLNRLPCGYSKEDGEKMHCSVMMFAHRMGRKPPTFLVEASTLFDSLHIQPMEDLWTHNVPEARKTTLPSSTIFARGELERSTCLVSCLLKLLCAPGGFALEMGCGTAPLMHACQAYGYSCFSFDNDAIIITSIVLPSIEDFSRKSVRFALDTEDVSTESYDVMPASNPWDD